MPCAKGLQGQTAFCAAFVASLENILELHQRPRDVHFPVVNLDEQPVQCLEKLRAPLPMQLGQVARVDYEYKRNGTASIFLLAAPLTG